MFLLFLADKNKTRNLECEICKQLLYDGTQIAKPDSCACWQWKDTVPIGKSIDCLVCRKPFTIVILCDLLDLKTSSRPEGMLDLPKIMALDEDEFGNQDIQSGHQM